MSDEEIPPYSAVDVRKYAFDALMSARDAPECFTYTRGGGEKRIAWKTLRQASTGAARMCAMWTAQGDPFAVNEAVKWAAAFALLEIRKKRLLKER